MATPASVAPPLVQSKCAGCLRYVLPIAFGIAVLLMLVIPAKNFHGVQPGMAYDQTFWNYPRSTVHNMTWNGKFHENLTLQSPFDYMPSVDMYRQNQRFAAAKAHAYVMIFSLIILMPIGVALGMGHHTWPHRICQSIVVILATLGVLLGSQISDSINTEPQSMHHAWGLVILLALWFQVALGLVRFFVKPAVYPKVKKWIKRIHGIVGYGLFVSMAPVIQALAGLLVVLGATTNSSMTNQFVAHVFAWWIYVVNGHLYLLASEGHPKKKAHRVEHRILLVVGIFYSLGELEPCVTNPTRCPDWTAPHLLQGLNFFWSGLLGIFTEIGMPALNEKGIGMCVMLVWQASMYWLHDQPNEVAQLSHRFHALALTFAAIHRLRGDFRWTGIFFVWAGYTILFAQLTFTVFAVGYMIMPLHYCLAVWMLGCAHVSMVMLLKRVGKWGDGVVDPALEFMAGCMTCCLEDAAPKADDYSHIGQNDEEQGLDTGDVLCRSSAELPSARRRSSHNSDGSNGRPSVDSTDGGTTLASIPLI